MQLISGLRRAGHTVTYSMPLTTYLGRKNIDLIAPLLTDDELWASEHFWEPNTVIHRVQPDVVITCNVGTFQTPLNFSNEVVQILDFYGPLQFEGLLISAQDYEAAMHDGPLLQERCQAMVRSFRNIDYIVTVSERQKYFWSAYCSLAGFSFAELDVLVCPAAFDIPAIERNPSPQLSVVYSGGFYPWQSPNRFLEAAACILDGIEGAALHVFGGPHEGLINEADVRKFLDELQLHSSVRYHGYRPVEEVLATLGQAWCALELMERNIERELAITGRTLEFLSTGTPVIYNNYSTLSRLIEKYGAGWTVPVEDEPRLRPIFDELLRGGPTLVNELSQRALTLASQEFSPDKAIAPLAQLCGSPELSKRPSRIRAKLPKTAKRSRLGRVLATSQDVGSLLDLRVRNPLRALHRQGLLEQITIASCHLHELRTDHRTYDVILTQRALLPQVYNALENLSLKFVVDVDDNLLARASYRIEGPELGLARGLRSCTAVTVPSPRLLRLLERYTGLSLADRAFIAPNSLPFAEGNLNRPAQPPSQMIWIQSDIAALDRSRREVLDAVSTFLKRHEMPVLLIGPNVLLDGPQFPNQIVMGQIDFTANLQLLANAPLSLGVAPLETQGDRETLDFIAGKSDLKILLFAGYGHGGVYSAAPPYTDSPLQNGLSIIGNSRAEWDEALEYEFREGWKHVSEIAKEIQAERSIDKVVRESWLPALESARLSRPISGAELYEVYRSGFEMAGTPDKSIAYLAANDDVLANCMVDENYTALRHYEDFGRAEGRTVDHTLQAQTALIERVERESSELAAELAEQIADLRSKSDKFSDQRDQLINEKDQLIKELSRLSQENETFANTLSAIVGSRSWRLTAPLRNLRNQTFRRGTDGNS